VCPSQIPLAHRFRLARGRVREATVAARKSGESRERHEQRQRRLRDEAAARQRAFEEVRARALPAARGSDGGDDKSGEAS
jgi:Na+-translocating ferredoxin:NAD+ oxidoreductase RnfC subunit